ncbi:MAG TPA: hypothetical protein VF381_11030, partial [Thermoanaerobaculia bacterium]
KTGRNVGPGRSAASAWDQRNVYSGDSAGSLTNPTMWKVEDTQIFGPNLYLTGLFSKVQGGFQLVANNGVGCDTLTCALNSLPAYLDSNLQFQRSFESYFTVRPQTQYRADGSSFFSTGSLSHELKFGTGYRDAKVRSVSVWPGNQYTVDNGGNGTGLVDGVYLLRPVDFTYSVKTNDLYVGDTMMLGNLTLQAAVRWDQQKAAVEGGSVAANSVAPTILPSISWNGISGLKWHNIDPRVGLTYTLGADKRTLLRAAYSRYDDQLGGATVYSASPGAYNYLYYYFNDVNHDHVAQPGEIDFTTLGAVVGLDPNKTTVANPVVRWGNVKAPTTDEFVLGLEREVVSDLSFGVNGTYRKLNDFLWNQPEKHQGQGDYYTSADYVLHAPVTATMPDGSKVSLPYYVVNTAGGVSAPIYYVVNNRPGYYQTYKSLEFTATKRMSNRWMLRGNLTLQDWKQHVSSSGIIDPTIQRTTYGCSVCNDVEVLQGSGTGSGAKGGVYINSKWAYNLTGAYQIPVVETSLGFNITGRQGYAIPYAYRINTFSEGVINEGFKFLLADNKTDAFRHPNLTEVDLRLQKDLKIQRVGLTLSVDAFNILNDQTVLQRDVTRLNRSSSNHITELQSPRVFRLGARLSF